MNITRSESIIALVGYHEETLELAQVKVAQLRAELTKAEDAVIGAKEELRKAKEAAHKAQAAIPNEETGTRERDIASMQGWDCPVGSPLTQEVRERIANGSLAESILNIMRGV